MIAPLSILFGVVLQGGTDLVNPFIEALNSKDSARLTRFVDSNFYAGVPSAERVKRLQTLADARAPFIVVKLADSTPDWQRALIRDRNSEEFALSLMLKGGRIEGLLLGPTESLDEPAPKNYTQWEDLKSLTSLIRKDTNCPALGIGMFRPGAQDQVAVDGVLSIDSPAVVTLKDPWHIGSIGKSMTSTLIGKLIELGKLRWDMTLREALPNVVMKRPYEKVTLEQLMHHRGGIPQDMGFTQAQVERICGDEMTPVGIRSRYAADILNRAPVSTPGTEFAYSNAGYALLGHIAEIKMKSSYEALMHKYVFKPLGMTSAIVGADPVPKRRIHGHIKVGGKLVVHDMDGKLGILLAPAGNTQCSVQDLGHFGLSHLKGLKGQDGLLKATTVARLHQGMPEDDRGPDYACGWSIGPLPGTLLRHGHNGSNGTFIAEMAIFPDKNLVVVAMANRGWEADSSPPLQAVATIGRKFAPKEP